MSTSTDTRFLKYDPESLKREILTISSGTLASLFGVATYTAIENYTHAWIAWLSDNPSPLPESWMSAWTRYQHKDGVATPRAPKDEREYSSYAQYRVYESEPLEHATRMLSMDGLYALRLEAINGGHTRKMRLLDEIISKRAHCHVCNDRGTVRMPHHQNPVPCQARCEASKNLIQITRERRRHACPLCNQYIQMDGVYPCSCLDNLRQLEQEAIRPTLSPLQLFNLANRLSNAIRYEYTGLVYCLVSDIRGADYQRRRREDEY